MIGAIDDLVANLTGKVDKREVGGLHSSGYRVVDDSGPIKLAEHVDTGTMVRMLVIPKSTLATSEAFQHAAQLVELLAAIDNLHIAYVFEVMTDSSSVTLVFENWESFLGDYLEQQGSLSEDVLGELVWQIVAGLKVLHEQGLALGGVNLHSHAFADDGNLKAVEFSELVSTNKDSGKKWKDRPLKSMLPEQVRKEDRLPLQTDLWDLGSLIYTMVKGSPPFEGIEDEDELRSRLSNAEIVLPGFVSPSLKALLRRLLASNPKDRGSIETLLEHEWMIANMPPEFSLDLGATEVNTAALLKMSTNFKVDKQFQKAMVDSLMTNCKNWLTAK